MGIRSKSTREKRHLAIIEAVKTKHELDLNEVNSYLRPDYRFGNQRELAQVARQVRDRVPELWTLN